MPMMGYNIFRTSLKCLNLSLNELIHQFLER
jgi:hypothetical protein